MKLTKQLEAEILKVYHAYWDAYLKGDMKTFASMLDDNITVYGTAISEVFTNKKETVRFYKATADQMTGKTQFRNRQIRMQPVDNTIVINEQTDLYVLIEKKWTFYGHARVTAIFQQTKAGWKLVHQHGSFPDSRTEEGEQIAIEKIKEENLQLRDAVKRRTIELENKNRELEIEASLEKVRAVAMGMKKPDDMLEICQVISQELTSLGIKELRNTQTAIIDEGKASYLNYEYFRLNRKTVITPVEYKKHKDVHAFVKKMQNDPEGFFTKTLRGSALKDYIVYQTKVGQYIDPQTKKASSLHYYFYSIGPGALGVSTYNIPLDKEAISLVKRFRNVFQLAYRRFIDIEKAIAQAREAQIELGLERVRARAMAMQHSDELAELVTVVFNELTHLDFHITSSIIWINNPELLTNTLWVTSAEMNQPAQPIQLAPFQHDFFHSIIHAWKEKDPKWIYLLTGNEKSSFEKSFFKGAPGLPKALKSALTVPENVVFSATFNNFGALELIGTEPLTDEKFDILHRFGKVFDSSYTRFNDLKKAEAQAKEAQIQLALERVRARTMAMQRSDELQDAASLMVQQIQTLGVPQFGSGFNIWDDDRKAATAWMCNVTTDNLPPPFKTSSSEDIFIDIHDAAQKGESLFVREQAGKELETHYRYMNSIPIFKEYVESASPEGLVIPEFQIMHCVYFSQGYLMFITYEPVPEAHDIFKRFAKVFEQTYTRFLDLQKAEAQAKEAQIETALERVRSRTMAMHNSVELEEVISVVYNQLRHLNLDVDVCTINIFKEGTKDFNIWIATPDQVFIKEIHVPFLDNPLFTRTFDAKNRSETFLTDYLTREEKDAYYKHAIKNSLIGSLITEERKKNIFEAPGFTRSFSILKQTGLLIANFKEHIYTEEENGIIKRFGQVFEQTYTRFLDLQKAEAQAREAQIEAALERVRSRTMAMQRSDELLDVATVLFQQVKALGVPQWNCGFNIWNIGDKEFTYYPGSPDGIISPSPCKIPLTEHPVFKRFDESRKRGDELLVYEKEGEEQADHYRYMLTLPGIGDLLRSMLDAGFELPKFQIDHLANFSHGNLLFITYEHFPEMHDIFKRFAKVFEQTYTRFLDLQKAEEQARESQIEAALERVRSRSMAMHKSEELLEASEILFLEMQKLGIESLTAGFVLMDKEEQNGFNYTPNPSTKKILPLPVIIPHDETIHMQQIVKNWKDGKPFFIVEMDEDETIKHQTFIAERSTNFPLSAAQLIAISPAKLFLHNFFFKEGYLLIVGGIRLSEEQTGIMLRFTKVFQQTYTRFLDLQKAEAQAREAQIEAALERTRTQSMIMQHSKELDDTLRVFHQQVLLLGIPSAFSFLWLPDEDKDQHKFWAAWAENNSTDFNSKAINYPLDRNEPATAQCLLDWKSNEPVYSYHVPPASVENYFTIWSELIAGVEQLKPEYFSSGLFYVEAFMKYGCFGVMVKNELKEDEKKILARFAIEFERTYTRFLDLQKSEFQTHQAKIETALEKVRARALAMQQPEELTEVAQVMRYEMGLLGVEELETSSIYIHDDASENAECWYAIKDIRVPEKKLLSDHFSLNLKDTWVGRQMFDFYQSNKKQISIPMQGTNRKEWIDYCSRESKLLDGFYGAVIPDRTYHLYKFSNGTIGAATPGNISAESWDLLQRAASVFSLAYSRFKDLTQARTDLLKLKEEKQRAEDALTDLQAAQKQLIQAEKMASLGELTAGIAHEIQNPLNFVNNFSEVNKELLAEMNDEIGKGNYDEAKVIAKDVTDNEEKINFHGKRADAIVKGMLQHSRSSSGVKEPTDINALADEYLRLAYHGLRAKDKSFNASMKTDYDESIENINIIPQDIGRVILNLITNAFYAVQQKQKEASGSEVIPFKKVSPLYEPTVSVTTKKEAGKIFVSVKDNGNGIPPKVLDKIFQPFFTTKPTGQGTGLGLSLSYDIVKAHGGELKVETKYVEGLPAEASAQAGSEFIILLPNLIL